MFSFLFFSFVILVDGPEPWVLLAVNHLPRANNTGKLDAKQVSGRFKAMCQPEKWRLCFKQKKRSGTAKVPGEREGQKGYEKKKLFFPSSLKRKNKDNTGFDIEIKWKLSLHTCLESTDSAGFPLTTISLLASSNSKRLNLVFVPISSQ